MPSVSGSYEDSSLFSFKFMFAVYTIHRILELTLCSLDVELHIASNMSDQS